MFFYFNFFLIKLFFCNDVCCVLSFYVCFYLFIFCLYFLLYDNLNKKIIIINLNKFIV